LIRDVFTDGPKEHLDIAPEDVGLGPYDSWYRKARDAAGREPVSRDRWEGEQLAAWNAMMNLPGAKIEAGVLRARAASNDPAFSIHGLRLRASRYARVVVEMRVSEPGAAQLFWSTASRPDMSESASLHLPTAADGQFHRYAFEVAKNEHWGGCVTGLRVDPAVKAGVLVEIRAIRLEYGPSE
jgi:hypothetical protein